MVRDRAIMHAMAVLIDIHEFQVRAVIPIPK